MKTFPESLREFKVNYPAFPARMRVAIKQSDLFSIDKLVALAEFLPPSLVEYNEGDLPIEQDPDQTPKPPLTVEETIRSINSAHSWVVLKQIERAPEYGNFLASLYREIEPVAFAKTGSLFKREAFIFISSSGAVTPFHMDPEHNILCQISGSKTFCVYPVRVGDLINSTQYESFHGPNGNRNLPYRPEFDRFASKHTLLPGDAIYVPVTAPHWVKVGGSVSISLSLTWRSRSSDNTARLYRANHWLRARGLNPPEIGAAPLRDRTKIVAQRISSRVFS